MQTWTLVRFLHILGLVFFIGGQLLFVTVVAPTFRGQAQDAMTRSLARRFGIGTVVALALVIATGVAMASHYMLWSSHVLQIKLMLLALVGVLTAFHILSPRSRVISYTLVVASLVVLWLGVKLTYV